MVIVVHSRRTDQFCNKRVEQTLSSWIQLRHASSVIEVNEFLTLSLETDGPDLKKIVY